MKEFEALKRIETTFNLNKQNRPSVYNDYTNSVEPYYRDYDLVEKAVKALEIIKPLCEVYETPKRTYRYLKVGGVVVYSIKSKEEYDLLEEVATNERFVGNT